MINELLASPFVLKLGVSLQKDVEKLCNDHKSVCGNALDALIPLVWPFYEMQSSRSARGQTISLAEMVSINLNLSLDKEQQTSDWGCRPLNAQQRTYAALDAWICLPLFDALFASPLRLSLSPPLPCGLHTAPWDHHLAPHRPPRLETRVVPADVAGVDRYLQRSMAIFKRSYLQEVVLRSLPADVAGVDRYLQEVVRYLRSLPAGSAVPLTGESAPSSRGGLCVWVLVGVRPSRRGGLCVGARRGA